MTSSTSREAADVECPNQEAGRCQELSGQPQSCPLGGGSCSPKCGSQKSTRHQTVTSDRSFLHLETPKLKAKAKPCGRIFLEWAIRSQTISRGKKAIHLNVRSRPQKKEERKKNLAVSWAVGIVVLDGRSSSLQFGFPYSPGEPTDSWGLSRRWGYMREMCLGGPWGPLGGSPGTYLTVSRPGKQSPWVQLSSAYWSST